MSFAFFFLSEIYTGHDEKVKIILHNFLDKYLKRKNKPKIRRYFLILFTTYVFLNLSCPLDNDVSLNCLWKQKLC